MCHKGLKAPGAAFVYRCPFRDAYQGTLSSSSLSCSRVTFLFFSFLQDSEKHLLSATTSPPPASAAHNSAARREALNPAANLSTSSVNASDARAHAQTDEEEEAKAPDLAKALAEILEFPADLDGPNDPALLGAVSHNSSPSLQGMVAPSSRLFRPEGRYPPCTPLVPLSHPLGYPLYCSWYPPVTPWVPLVPLSVPSLYPLGAPWVPVLYPPCTSCTTSLYPSLSLLVPLRYPPCNPLAPSFYPSVTPQVPFRYPSGTSCTTLCTPLTPHPPSTSGLVPL